MFEETAQEGTYTQDPWASAMVLHEELSRDRYYTRRYEGMLWHERPRLLGFANDLQHEPFCGAPETWKGQPDPWVDQLLLSQTEITFRVPLSLVPLIMYGFY
jgi:hypothetical protein